MKLEKLFLEKFSTVGTGGPGQYKERDEKFLLSYLDRFKRTYYEIKGINQDTVITCFEGGFRSRMLYMEL